MELSMMTFMLEFPVLFFKPGTREEKSKEIESFVQLTAKTGYTKIDLIWQTIRLIGKKEIRRMLDDNHLQLNCIIYMGAAENDEDTPDVVSACEYFGCRKLMLVPGHLDVDKKEFFSIIVKNYTRVVSLAAPRGIVCVCEDDPDIRIPCGTREELDALLSAVPGLRLVYDSANMLPSCEESIPYYEHFADQTSYIHIKDMQIAESRPEGYSNPGADGRFYINAPHGTGVVDFAALSEALKKHGYNDTLAIEFIPRPDMSPEEDMKQVYDKFASLFCFDAGQRSV